MTEHRVGTREEWLEASRELVAREKEHMRQGDDLARQRRDLPWVRIDKDYEFETNEGPRTLAELFGGRSQLIVYHFMFGPDDTVGCTGCSFLCDNLDGAIPHVNANDLSVVVVSRGPLEKLNAYRERMGWEFDWVSSEGSDFNFDFGVSSTEEQPATGTYNFEETTTPFGEGPGLSAFVLEDGVVYHAYSSYARGLEALDMQYSLLDRAPKGRQEDDLPHPGAWWRRHDEYEVATGSR
jgi:predicted dithiol-disulfide oxidoreductase (DUF899 family)